MKTSKLIPEMLAGAIAGYIATWPMTSIMEHFDDADIEQPQSALPPRTITVEALQNVSGEQPPEEIVRPATKVAHYGYGATVGSLFPLTPRSNPDSTLLSGTAFGLGVWAGSYFGLLPALGSSARATNRSLRVNAIMIAAHVVWGVGVAMLTDAQLQMINWRADEQEGSHPPLGRCVPCERSRDHRE